MDQVTPFSNSRDLFPSFKPSPYPWQFPQSLISLLSYHTEPPTNHPSPSSQLGPSSDTGINILFEPKQGGKHTLTVMLGGKNYPGTPVDVEVQGL